MKSVYTNRIEMQCVGALAARIVNDVFVGCLRGNLCDNHLRPSERPWQPVRGATLLSQKPFSCSTAAISRTTVLPCCRRAASPSCRSGFEPEDTSPRTAGVDTERERERERLSTAGGGTNFGRRLGSRRGRLPAFYPRKVSTICVRYCGYVRLVCAHHVRRSVCSKKAKEEKKKNQQT